MSAGALSLFSIGAAVMISELLWARALALALGSDLEGLSLGLGLFLLGMASGSAVGSRSLAAPGRWILLALAGMLGVELWVQIVVPHVTVSWAALGSVWGRLAVALPVTVPAFFLGGAVPAWFRAPLGDDRVETRAGRWICALDLGSAMGALLTPLVFLPLVGAGGSFAIAAVFLGGAWWCAREPEGSSGNPSPGAPGAARRKTAGTDRSRRTPAPRRANRWSRAALIFAGGAIGFALEITWARILGEVLGASLFVLGLASAALLLGGGLGSACAPVLLRRWERGTVIFATWSLWGGAQAASYAWILAMPQAYVESIAFAGTSVTFALKVAFVTLAVLPASACAGFLLPCLAAGWSGNERELARETGRLQASGVLGGTAGALLAGFALIPSFGSPGTLVLLGFVTFALTLGVAIGCRVWRGRAVIAGGALTTAAALVFVIGGGSWDPALLGAGVFQWNRADIASGEALGAWRRRDILFQTDGRLARVTIERARDFNTAFLRVGGRVEGSVPIDRSEGSLADLPTAVMLGLLPSLFVDGTGSTAVIGLGGGTTAATAVALNSGPVTIFELEPQVAAALSSPAGRETFRWEAETLFEKGNARGIVPTLVFEDARSYLHRSPARWQAIVCQPSEPWIPWSAPLFTPEFYSRISSRLTLDGVAVHWVQLYRIPEAEFAGILAGFRASFAEVWVFHPHPEVGEVILVGQSAAGDPRVWRERWAASAPQRQQLPYGWEKRPQPIMDTAAVDRWLRGFPQAAARLRDRLEFRLPLLGDRGEDHSGRILASLRAVR